MEKLNAFRYGLEQWMNQPPRPGRVTRFVHRREVQTVLCGIAFLVSLVLSEIVLGALRWEGPIGYPFSAIMAGVVLTLFLSWIWYSHRS